MTREEILAMKPGPELDALVAEKVMGTPVHWERAVAIGNRIEWVRCEPYRVGEIRRTEDDKPVPPYSTDIAAAWEVIAHLYSEGWYWYMGIDEEGPFFRLVLQGAGEDGADLMASCDGVLPEDICMTALLAMEEQPMG